MRHLQSDPQVPQAHRQLSGEMWREAYYRGKDYATDVLSFAEDFKNFVDLPDDRKYLGEIVISVVQAKKQANDLKCSLKNEVARLIVHGLAHLVGYDHENTTKEEADKMLAFERKVLERLGIWELFQFEEEIPV